MSLASQVVLGFQRLSAELKKKPSLDASGHLPIEVQRAPVRALKAFQRTGAQGETISRLGGLASVTGFAGARPYFFAAYMLKGFTVSNISFTYGGTGATTLTHCYFALFDSNFNRVAISADDTTAAWSAYTERTYPMQVPYTVPADGIYYLMICAEGQNITLSGQTIPGTVGFLDPAIALGSGKTYAGGASAAPTVSPGTFVNPAGIAWAWYG